MVGDREGPPHRRQRFHRPPRQGAAESSITRSSLRRTPSSSSPTPQPCARGWTITRSTPSSTRRSSRVTGTRRTRADLVGDNLRQFFSLVRCRAAFGRFVVLTLRRRLRRPAPARQGRRGSAGRGGARRRARLLEVRRGPLARRAIRTPWNSGRSVSTAPGRTMRSASSLTPAARRCSACR